MSVRFNQIVDLPFNQGVKQLESQFGSQVVKDALKELKGPQFVVFRANPEHPIWGPDARLLIAKVEEVAHRSSSPSSTATSSSGERTPLLRRGSVTPVTDLFRVPRPKPPLFCCCGAVED